ncbi:MAG: hypothetical protein ACFB4I_23150 [Cyanophyceae cyanobacterium]
MLSSVMVRKTFFWLLWGGFIAYAIFLAPAGGAANVELLIQLFTLQWSEINAIVLSLLALVGFWIAAYSAVLFIDGTMQKIPYWLFAVASLGTGVIGLLPYLALRDSNQEFQGSKNNFLKFWDSPLTALNILTAIVALGTYVSIADGGREFLVQFQTLRFVNVMTVALILFWLGFPTVVGDDLARRGVKNKLFLTLITIVPVFGAIAYWGLRPQLSAERETQE